MAAPHAIHEEFPNDAQRIHDLKVSNAHFARLLEEYDSINDEVAAAETLVKPVSEDTEKQLRRQRTLLKDQIARMIASVES